ncbi:thrombomodulin [Fundulus heteroclitus]|uniref:thrombomodulin n=1 Tax=Fundulus heteroclitus TaxID=8078 RepID=UPI00165BDB0B|nr:thrombomodulin [Fundulus heteroclitus]
MAALVSALLLLFTEPGSGLTAPCLPVCSGEDCITVNRASVDFDTAEKACRGRNGELLTLQADTHQRIFAALAEALPGDLWVGLRLPAGSCSRRSEPLRGYEWTSGSPEETSNASLLVWAEGPAVCSPHCASLSQHGTVTERPCSHKADGFLCRTKEKSACWEQEKFFKSSADCGSAPCEQKCDNAKGGFKCSCFKGYIPDVGEPRRCRLHCPHHKCPPICPGGPGGPCHCADGFLLNEGTCEDLDECTMDRCEQGCVNTYGSFMCFCRLGFVLKDEVKCTVAAGRDRSALVVVPTQEDPAVKGSSASAGPFLWIWVVAAVVLVASVFLIRLYVVHRQKRREESCSQQGAAPADDPDP